MCYVVQLCIALKLRKSFSETNIHLSFSSIRVLILFKMMAILLKKTLTFLEYHVYSKII